MMDKKEFLENNHIAAKYNELERKNPQLWQQLYEIGKAYEKQENYLEGILQAFIKDMGCSDHIHSLRYRIKKPESLMVKIIDKKFSNVDGESKYNDINADNYHKILTDLIGVRIIIRYRYEWQAIHKMIWDKYYNEEKEYVIDYEKDYSVESYGFIAERPLVYYRDITEKKNYEAFGRNLFDIKYSGIGYSSIHYIINYHGQYIELQVRTIYDEAWSECDHDFVYKLNASPKKMVLKRCSKMLSEVTGVADGLSTFIRDYYTDEVFAKAGPEEEYQRPAEEKPEALDSVNKKHPIEINKVSDVFLLF